MGVGGRGEELRVRAGLGEALLAGRGRAVWVEGEPGIGKSTLVGRLADAAEVAGCQVFRSAAAELTLPLPLQLLVDSLGVSARSDDPPRAQIARPLRGRARAPAAPGPGPAARAPVVELGGPLCAARPALLVPHD